MAKWMLDLGHGGSDPGSTNKFTTEARMNLIVGLETAKVLKDNGETVFLTRTTDQTVSLTERCIKANNAKVDYFVSIHHNSYNGSARGCEIIYSLKTPKIFAERVLNNLVNGMGVPKRSVYQRTKRDGSDYYAVLNGTKMQAIITEFCFIDNSSDYGLVDSDYKLKKEGFYIAKGCLENVGKNIKDIYRRDSKPPVVKTNPIPVKQNNPLDNVVNFVISREGKNTYTQSELRFKPNVGYSDCSSLMYYAYKTYGNIDIGTYTEPQSLRGRQIGKIDILDESLMKKGDLVFYRGHSGIDKSRPYGIGHVEMYIGNNTLMGHGYGIGPTRKKLSEYRRNDFCMVRRYLESKEVPIAPAKPQKKSKYFKDIPENHWSIDAFDKAKELGILVGNGDGTVGFTPDKAMMISVVLRSHLILKNQIPDK